MFFSDCQGLSTSPHLSTSLLLLLLEYYHKIMGNGKISIVIQSCNPPKVGPDKVHGSLLVTVWNLLNTSVMSDLRMLHFNLDLIVWLLQTCSGKTRTTVNFFSCLELFQKNRGKAQFSKNNFHFTELELLKKAISFPFSEYFCIIKFFMMVGSSVEFLNEFVALNTLQKIFILEFSCLKTHLLILSIH